MVIAGFNPAIQGGVAQPISKIIQRGFGAV
jgi:hypothetical protein